MLQTVSAFSGKFTPSTPARGLTVSVVTPSFNGGRFIGETIKSVLAQDWPELEYLVQDAGSTDQTLDVVRSFGNKVRCVSEPDTGQADALNKGFARTNGDILAWLNTDDTWEPGAVRAAAEYLAAHPDVAMVYADAQYIDADGHRIAACAHVEPFSISRLYNYSDFIVQPAAFFRRSAFEAVGGLDSSLHWAMDYDLWLKLAKRFPIAYLPRVLANYRWVGGSKTESGGWRRLDELSTLLGRYHHAMPAYIRLERVNAHARDAMESIGQAKFASAATSLARAAGNLLVCPRAVGSLFTPHTWRVIYTGQVLRARAAAATKDNGPLPGSNGVNGQTPATHP